MTVVKLVGRADNFDLVFRQDDRGLWDATVPSVDDGVYILDLLAVDAAGNESRYAKVLFVVDTPNICCKFTIRVIGLIDNTDKIAAVSNMRDIVCVPRTDHYSIVDNTTWYNLVVRGCDCG